MSRRNVSKLLSALAKRTARGEGTLTVRPAPESSVFRVSEEVRSALNEKRPVVALESTIYTHGWPFPDNVELSSRLEALVRQHGGVPAHCAVLEGVARVGMEKTEMQQLLETKGACKVSRRDLGMVTGSVW